MIVREILPEEKEQYNKVVSHVMQSYEWGEFRKAMGVKALRMGVFEGKDLKKGFTVTIHSIPLTNFTIGYLPKGDLPDELLISTLKKIGKGENCLFIKLEPNVEVPKETTSSLEEIPGLKLSPKSLFTKYTFCLDLTKSEEELLSLMKEKTRYNVRLAQRHGVTVAEEGEAFGEYLRLLKGATKRNKFFAHDEKYHLTMWKVLQSSGIAHLMVARYHGEMLAAWILFTFSGILYYPYGASSSLHRELMASNLMMWEAMRFGKRVGCHLFDMWGSLGPNADTSDPWYGFHRFKEGYGGRLVEFVGSYDLVINPALYPWYFRLDKVRWGVLKILRLFGI